MFAISLTDFPAPSRKLVSDFRRLLMKRLQLNVISGQVYCGNPADILGRGEGERGGETNDNVPLFHPVREFFSGFLMRN